MKGDAKGKSADRQTHVLYPVASDLRYFDIWMLWVTKRTALAG